jgi:hypothetical protein
MTNGAHVEKVRLAAMWQLHTRAKTFTVTPAMYADDGTPNQRAESAGNALAVSAMYPHLVTPAHAQAQLLNFLHTQDELGHMTVNLSHFNGIEQFVSEPHDYLWGAGKAMALYESSHQKLVAEVAACVDWWAAHIQCISHFWTDAGLAIPCARAQSLPAQFTWENRVYALIMFGLDGNLAARRYGNIEGTVAHPHPAAGAFNILRSCAPLFKRIVSRSHAIPLELAVPIRKWASADGSYVAAFADGLAANVYASVYEPMSWCEVDKSGHIVTSGRTLDTFTAPKTQPVVIGA